MVIPPTPLRARDVPLVDGCRVLGRPDIGWLDGSEDDLYRRVLAATDLSSGSDELAESARTWPEHYHLSTARANVVRPFLFRPDHRVLEVSAGCGAVTRWLGEQSGLVDALEPVQQRARVARARTRDLDSVEVFVGDVGDVPKKQTYDVVVVMGVLAYLGGGTADPRPYVAFLEDLRGLLAPEGRLLLAIENKLGVKYLAGAPEDHTNRVFDSVEGYPVGSPARTFSRTELADLVLHAGYESCRVFGAFPDYKLTRLVYSEELAGRAPELLKRLPAMPSPDWVVPRPVLADESMLWTSFVDAGLASEVANSFVVLAESGEPSGFWPENVLATYFSLGRRSAYAMRSTVCSLDGAVVIDRRPEFPDEPGPSWLRLRPGREVVVEGLPLARSVPPGDVEGLLVALSAWLAALRRFEDPQSHIDAVPGNVLRDGDVSVVDDEWDCSLSSLGQVVMRGLYHLVVDLARDPAWAVTWRGMSVREVVRDLAGRLGIDGSDTEGWEDLEAGFQHAALHQFDNATVEDLCRSVHERLASPIEPDPPSWMRHFERYGPWLAAERDRLAGENAALHTHQDEMRRMLQSRDEEIRTLDEEIRTIVDDPWYRAGERYRSAVTAIAPPGTRRRKAYAAVRRRRTSSS